MKTHLCELLDSVKNVLTDELDALCLEHQAKASDLETRFKEACERHLTESTLYRDKIQAQEREISTLTIATTELKSSLDEWRYKAKALADEKHLLQLEVNQLKEQGESHRFGLGKLADFIRRRHRPDNVKEEIKDFSRQ